MSIQGGGQLGQFANLAVASLATRMNRNTVAAEQAADAGDEVEEQSAEISMEYEDQFQEVEAEEQMKQRGTDQSAGVFSATAKSESAAGPWSDPSLVQSLNVRI